MKKKLTLTIEQSLIDFAKLYGDLYGLSVSSLVEKALSDLMKHKDPLLDIKIKEAKSSHKEQAIDEELKSLAGSFSDLDSDIDYKLEYKEYRAKKVLQS